MEEGAPRGEAPGGIRSHGHPEARPPRGGRDPASARRGEDCGKRRTREETSAPGGVLLHDVPQLVPRVGCAADYRSVAMGVILVLAEAGRPRSYRCTAEGC